MKLVKVCDIELGAHFEIAKDLTDGSLYFDMDNKHQYIPFTKGDLATIKEYTNYEINACKEKYQILLDHLNDNLLALNAYLSFLTDLEKNTFTAAKNEIKEPEQKLAYTGDSDDNPFNDVVSKSIKEENTETKAPTNSIHASDQVEPIANLIRKRPMA